MNILNSNYSKIDANLFVFFFDPVTPVFTIESHDIDYIGTYNLKVIAKYEGSQYTKMAELPFTVTVDDHCAPATLTIDPTILSLTAISYKIGYETNEQTFTQEKVSSTGIYCPTYVFSIEN